MVEVAAGWQCGSDDPVDVVAFRPPDEHEEVELAVRAVRLHAQQEAIYGGFCGECGWAWPCVTRRWGVQLLQTAGRAAVEIEALDGSSGARHG